VCRRQAGPSSHPSNTETRVYQNAWHRLARELPRPAEGRAAKAELRNG
jgi:hypothetical protein